MGLLAMLTSIALMVATVCQMNRYVKQVNDTQALKVSLSEPAAFFHIAGVTIQSLSGCVVFYYLHR